MIEAGANISVIDSPHKSTPHTSVRVLFSSAGRRVELIECFRRAGEELGVSLQALGCDLNPGKSAACQRADRSFAVPRCRDAEFIPKLLELCESERVTLVVPTIDTELEVLAENRERFRAIGVELVISAPDVVQKARNKIATQRFLDQIGITTPRTASLTEFKSQKHAWRFPIILKPLNGSSSIGLKVCQTPEEVERLDVSESMYMAQEYWTGREYTVNIFFDRSGMRCAIPHLRYETRAGEVSKGITERVPSLIDFANILGTALAGKAFGALCFQAIVNEKGESAVFEINARFGGGYPLADFAGAKFAKWILEIVLGRACTANQGWKAGVQMLRYDAAVFSDGAG